MNILGGSGDPNEVSAARWAEILDNTVQLQQSGNSWNGHVLVHIDDNSQYEIMNEADEDAENNMHLNNLHAIVKITMGMMGKADENTRVELTNKLLLIGEFMAARSSQEKVASKVFRKPQIDSKMIIQSDALPNWTSTPLVRKVETKDLEDVNKLEKSVVHLCANEKKINFLEKVLDANPTIRRSLNGKDGAWFFRVVGGENVVLKLCMQSESHVLADKILSNFFQVPKYREVSSSSTVGLRAKKTIKSEGGKFLDNQLKKRKKEGKIGDIGLMEIRIKQLPWMCKQKLLISDFMSATAFIDLMFDQRKKCLSDDQFLNQIGQMCLVDTVINNTDRLSEKQCNPGNFMVKFSEDGDAELVSIDHDYNLTQDNQDEVLKNLNSLFTKDGIKQRLLKLVGEDFKDMDHIIDEIFIGVLDGAEKLLGRFYKNDAYKMDFLIKSEGQYLSPDLEVLGKVLGQLKKLTKK